MQFPEDFEHFEKLSPRFGDVKKSNLFWGNMIRMGRLGDMPGFNHHKGVFADLKTMAFGGLLFAAKNDPKLDYRTPTNGCIDIDEIYESREISYNDWVVARYILMLGATPSRDSSLDKMGALACLNENNEANKLLSQYMDSFENLSFSDALLGLFSELLGGYLEHLDTHNLSVPEK